MLVAFCFELWLNFGRRFTSDFIHNPDLLIGYVDMLFICAAYKARYCERMLDAELLGV